jgi:hypothetical protein
MAMGMVRTRKDGRRKAIRANTSPILIPLLMIISINFRVLFISKINVKMKSPNAKGLNSSLKIYQKKIFCFSTLLYNLLF